jgi:hypothetical protein
MATYISSNANRIYTALESGYGQVGQITAANRIPAVKLAVRQQVQAGERKDKTGSRTFSGMPSGLRRRTTFDLTTYLTTWDKVSQQEPGYTPLFRAALGGSPLRFPGGTAAAGTHGTTVVLSGLHGLAVGQAIAHEGEIRFVSAIVNGTTVQVNAPFVNAPAAGARIGSTVTLMPATELPTTSVFDYWSPEAAVQRILYGAAVDQMEIRVNGDFHEIGFGGVARELTDNASFVAGVGALQEFPPEPVIDAYDSSIVPGHMGQAWLGTAAERFCTITAATVKLENDIDTRWREFGSCQARGIAPGRRKVTASFDLFSKDDEATTGLYQAARQQSPISVMFQLGEVEGQLMGVYLKSVIPEVPEFDDSENRLQWRFKESRAQGTVDDEIAVAFA